MTYRLTNLAKADLADIWLYIAEHRPQAARKVVAAITTRFRLLARHPQVGTARDDLKKGLRAFSWKKYVIYFEPRAEGILIVRVLHGSKRFSAFTIDADDDAT